MLVAEANTVLSFLSLYFEPSLFNVIGEIELLNLSNDFYVFYS